MMRPLRTFLADLRRGYRDAEIAALRLEVTALQAQLDNNTEETGNA